MFTRQEMSQEARDLIQRARDPDDLSWQLGEGIQVRMKSPVSLTEVSDPSRANLRIKINCLFQ